jgi:branched-chain amino acid transport system substrate-binding protein
MSFTLTWGCSSQDTKEIRVGVNAELTGSKPTVGDSCRKAAELLAAQVNQAGGLKVGNQQLPIKLIVEDNEDKAESAAAAAKSSTRTMSWRFSVPMPRAMPSPRPGSARMPA